MFFIGGLSWLHYTKSRQKHSMQNLGSVPSSHLLRFFRKMKTPLIQTFSENYVLVLVF